VHETTSSRILEDGTRRYRSRDLDRETLANIWTIITAPRFLQQIVLQTGLQNGRADMPEEAEAEPEALSPVEMETIKKRAEFLGKRQIRVRQDGSHIFEIAVRDPDPRQALTLARTILDRFLEEERANRMAPRTSTRDFLERQRQTYAEALQAAEDSLAVFQRSLVLESLVGNPVNASNVARIESNLSRMREQHFDADVNEMAILERQASSVVGTLPNIAVIEDDPAINGVLITIEDLLADRTVGTGSTSTDSELGRARVRLNTLVEQRINRDYSSLGIMNRNRLSQYVFFMLYRNVKEKVLEDLSNDVQAYRDFSTRQPEQSARLEELQDEVAERRDMLDAIEREISQQTINLEASMSEIGYRIEVRRDPELGRFPVEPDKMRLYFMGFALSMAIGFGLVVLSVMLDRTFTAVEDIERSLGLTVIGTLPVIQDEHFKRKRRVRLVRWLVLVTLILGVASVFLLYVYPRMS
jgi:capsular polysaccharide biosynthesis protein